MNKAEGGGKRTFVNLRRLLELMGAIMLITVGVRNAKIT